MLKILQTKELESKKFGLDKRPKTRHEPYPLETITEVEPTTYETIKLMLSLSKFYIKITYYFLKILMVFKMDSKTTKYANRSFWSTIVAILTAILGIFSLDLESLGMSTEQLITFLTSGAALVVGAFFSKKQGEATKDAE
jgi:H+/Cl- antiporter ClcA